jgi:hypothetical protein
MRRRKRNVDGRGCGLVVQLWIERRNEKREEDCGW